MGVVVVVVYAAELQQWREEREGRYEGVMQESCRSGGE